MEPVITRLKSFTAEYGLQVTLEDPARRLVKLTGSLDELQEAFGTTLHLMKHEGRSFRGREGPVTVPSDLCDHIESVLGLDNRLAATPKIAFPRVPEAATSYLPNQVAALYGFPKTSGRGNRTCVYL